MISWLLLVYVVTYDENWFRLMIMYYNLWTAQMCFLTETTVQIKIFTKMPNQNRRKSVSGMINSFWQLTVLSS